MMKNHRAALLWALSGLVVLDAASDAGAAYRRKLNKDQRVDHALNRLAFGARPGDLELVKKRGLDRWIDDQLHPERLRNSALLAERLKTLPTLSLSIAQVAEQYPLRVAKAKNTKTGSLRGLLTAEELRKLREGTPAEKLAVIEALTPEKRTALIELLPIAVRRQLLAAGSPELRREVIALGQPVAIVGLDLVESKLYRALYSERQLEEVLVDFWFNHFNVYLNKGPERLFVAAYERDAIRPHVLGKFSDMLLATAKHPAMLYYLDNWQSVDPKAIEAIKQRQSARKRGGGAFTKQLAKRTRGLNENYARELMELHTLGVDGGYTQEDVVNVARAFTGWTLRDPRRGAAYYFAPMLHDRTAKTVLGHKLAAGRGEEDGLDVLEILAHHPSTARFVSTKLAQRFVADQPPAALVARMAVTFSKTGGNLREVMKTMIAAPEFFSEGAYRAKLKSPFEMVVSAARAVNADVTNALVLSRSLDELGQPLYRKEEPTGYYNTADEWTNTAGLLGRMNFATALAANKLPGAKVDAAEYAQRGLALGAPDFQRR